MTQAIDQCARENSRLSGNAQQCVEIYFERFNSQQFGQVVELFESGATMYPPLDSAIHGREAILEYLQEEASGMRAHPKNYTVEEQPDGNTEVAVKGQAKTAVFKVNVGWTFQLNAANQIVSVRIKLLASLSELLKIKSDKA